MNRLRSTRPITRRATAWLLLLLLAWMGTGGVLHHTDDGMFCAAGAHSRAGLHGLLPPAPADQCAACEWTQGLQGKTLAVYHVQSPLFLLRPHSLTCKSSSLRRVLRLHPSRAPPAFQTYA